MLFASTDLARRIEEAECRLLVDSTEAAARRRGIDVLVRRVAGGVATFAVPGSPLNKVAGLAFAGPLVEDDLDALIRDFAERGSPMQVELSCLGEPSVGALLTRRGFVLQGFENVLGRSLPAQDLPDPLPGTDVSESLIDEIPIWLDTVVTGFDHPDDQGVPSHESFPRDLLEGVMADMATAEGFMRYLARREGAPAGGASLRLSQGVAQLCGAATLPAHRRKGVQTALLAHRLRVASEAGCDVAVVTTQPGSRSQENAQRRGFELLYTRAILVREPG